MQCTAKTELNKTLLEVNVFGSFYLLIYSVGSVSALLSYTLVQFSLAEDVQVFMYGI